MAKRMTIMIIALLVVFGGLFAWNMVRDYFTKKYFANLPEPVATVSAVKVTATSWQPRLNAVGSMLAVNGVNVSSQEPGKIIAILFKSGQLVAKGQPLIQLDAAKDQKVLQQYQAQLELSKLDYQRNLKVYPQGGVSKQALDQKHSQYQQDLASMQQQQVVVDRTTIRAPFAGKIGIRNVNLGQYINAGDSLVNLQSMNPLYVQFSLPEQDLQKLHINQVLQLSLDAYPKKTFTGKITAINSTVDNQTRNILIQGTVPNAAYLLYPGMFARVQVLLPKQSNVVVVPQTAVTFGLYGNISYVVKPGGKDKEGKSVLRAYQVFVKPGERSGASVVILSGLKPGDLVVTSGQLKLHDKALVEINNNVTSKKSS